MLQGLYANPSVSLVTSSLPFWPIQATVAIGNPERLVRKASHCGSKQQQSYICMVLFFTHIPFTVNHTFHAKPPERLQQHPLVFTTNHTDHTFFVWRLNSARPPHLGHSTIFGVSSSVTHKHELWIWFTLPMQWWRRYSGSRLFETRNRQGIWEVTLYNLVHRVLHWF